MTGREKNVKAKEQLMAQSISQHGPKHGGGSVMVWVYMVANSANRDNDPKLTMKSYLSDFNPT